MSSPLIFVHDGRTLPFVPITTAALVALRTTCEQPREGGERRSYPHALAVYVALLEFANDARESRVALNQTDLAKGSGMSRRTVQRVLDDVEAAGVVEVRQRTHGMMRTESEYIVVEPPVNESATLRHCDATLRQTDAHAAPDGRNNAGARPSHPSDARIPMEEEREEARERAPIPPTSNNRIGKFKTRPVPSSMLDRAVSVLELYNDIFGRALKPFSATGEQAPHLTQILGKVIECPDMETADFERVLRAVHANPPGFLDGQPVGLGDIFGPRAWTRALENTGSPSLAIAPARPIYHDRYSDKRQREIEREEAAQRVLAARRLQENQ